MMLNLIELSRFIQEVPRLNSSTVITRETIEIFNLLRNANVDQIRLLEQKIREGCQWCTHPVVVVVVVFPQAPLRVTNVPGHASAGIIQLRNCTLAS